jgi:hypothetical protein
MAVFTLSIENGNDTLDSVGIDIGFDYGVIEFLSSDFHGTLLAGWSFRQISNPAPGVLRLGAFSVENLILPGAKGKLVQLRFRVVGEQTCQLTLSALKDDFSGLNTEAGHFSYIPPREPIYVDCASGACGGKTPCYSSIAEAVSVAENYGVIKISEGTCLQGVTLDRSIDLTLEGGWDAQFNIGQGGVTTIDGMVIGKGIMIPFNLVISP